MNDVEKYKLWMAELKITLNKKLTEDSLFDTHIESLRRKQSK